MYSIHLIYFFNIIARVVKHFHLEFLIIQFLISLLFSIVKVQFGFFGIVA